MAPRQPAGRFRRVHDSVERAGRAHRDRAGPVRGPVEPARDGSRHRPRQRARAAGRAGARAGVRVRLGRRRRGLCRGLPRQLRRRAASAPRLQEGDSPRDAQAAAVVYAVVRDGGPFHAPKFDYPKLVADRNAPRWLRDLKRYGHLSKD